MGSGSFPDFDFHFAVGIGLELGNAERFGYSIEQDFFEDHGGGADHGGDQFGEESGLDEYAVDEHEQKPDGEEPQPGAEPGVGDAFSQGYDEEEEVSAGAEELGPCLGGYEGFKVPVESWV